VTMDMCMVALDDRTVSVGDVATIFGGRSRSTRRRGPPAPSRMIVDGAGAPRVRRYQGAM
jgi:hypothetical protein